MEAKGLKINMNNIKLCIVKSRMSKQKIKGSGHLECVERELEQTRFFVQFVSNGFIRDVVVYKVL